MRGDRPQDALAMVALAAGVAVLVAARHAGDWIAALGRSLHHTLAVASGPRALLLCLVLVGATVAAVLWRRRTCRDLLADRVELQLVPSPEFDPPIESVARLAAQLARTRRRGRGWLERPAAAVRFAIASDASGRLGYRVSAPAHAKQTLHAALGEYSELDVHQETRPAADANTEATALPNVTPHTMRRTYISIALLANNFDVKWVMSQVGHADSKMTMDVYAQLEQRVDRSHGTSFDTLIRKARHHPATTTEQPASPQRTLHAVA